MKIVGRLINIALSATLCIGLLPTFALAQDGSESGMQGAVLPEEGAQEDQLPAPSEEDAASDASLEDAKGEEASALSAPNDAPESIAADTSRASAYSGTMELSVSHGTLTTGSLSQFTLSVSNSSSDMQYHLDWVQRYDYGVSTAVVDPSKMPAFQTSNVIEFEFCTSGRYELQFQVIDREPLASGQPARTAKKKVTVDVTGAPSTEQLVQDIVASCSAAGMSTDYEKALWLHDYIIDKAEYVLKPSHAPNGPGYDFCNAEGVLARGFGTCESYHRAYVMLLNEAGISTGRMTGNGHVWTAVKMDGKWYQVDVTWDDPGYDVPGFDRKRLYFGLTDAIMAIVHPDHARPVPGYESSSLDNNYFIRSGAVGSLAAPSASLIQAELDAGEVDFAITVPNLLATEAYNDVLFRIAAYKLSNDAWTAKGKKANVSVSYASGQLHCKADVPITGDVKITQTDDQKMRGAFSVIVSGLPSTGIASVEAPTWSEANGQDDLEWYRLTSWQGVWTRELPCLTPNRQPGTYLTHVYVTTSQGNRVFIGGASANITLAPSSVKASVNAPETWFSVSASGGYASMADAVQFAVWSDAGGQDDLRWYSSTKRGAAWGNDIPVSLHATAGSYQVHAYALKGTQRSFVGGATFRVSAPRGKVELLSTDTNVYRLRVSDVHAPSGISAILDGAWAVVDGQDDLVWHQANGSAATGWTVIVSATEHRAQDGIYENHIYVACQNGIRACIGGCKAAMTVDNCPFVIGGMGSGKRTIGVRKAPSTQEMSFAVWSEANGQDDLVWYPAQRVSADTWQADIDCRRLRDSGTVAVHAYRHGGAFTTSFTFEVSRDDVSLSGDPELDAILRNIIEYHGTDLRSLYDYVASYPYISGSKYPAGDWTVPFAIEMYRNGGGNCYRYAALFEWLAKAAGYNAKAIAGHALNRYGGWNAHGWVEVYINGATYICDPQSTHAIAGRNFYMVTYENAPLTYRPW